MRHSLLFWILFTVFMFVTAPASQAQTNSTWDGATGNWSDFTHWSTNPIFPNNGQPNPSDTYNAIINVGTVTLDQNIVIQGLTLSSGVFVNGAGNLTTNAAVSWTGGTMNGAGTTNFNGTVTIAGSPVFGRTINNNGTTTWTSGTIFGQAGGTWNNQNGALFDAQTDGLFFLSTGAPVFNNLAGATFRKSAGTGTTGFDFAFNNSGTVQVNTGTLRLGSGSSSGAGTFNVASGATFDLNAYTLAAGTSINGAGNVTFENGTSTINGAFNATGAVTMGNPGQVNFNTNATFGSLTLLGGTWTGSGNVTVTGPSSWTLSTMSGTGTTTFNGPLTIPGNITYARTINNSGTTTWTSGTIFAQGSPWNNQNGAVFDAQTDGTFFLSSGSPVFNNLAGATFRKSAGAGTTTFDIPFNNSGTVQALSGTINFTSNSIFTQAAGTTTLNGGSITSVNAMNFNGGSLTGSGTIGASAVFGNATIAPGASAGTLTFNGNLGLNAGSTLNFELGTLSDSIIVNGNLTLDGTLNVAALAGFNQGTFVLIDYSGSLTDNGLDLGTLPGGFTYQIVNDAANTQIDLQVSAIGVPEPATWILGGASAIITSCAACTWRQKQRRCSNSSQSKSAGARRRLKRRIRIT